MVGSKNVALMVAAGLMILAASSAQADSLRITRIQAALDAWLADRSAAEKVTGVAGYISFGDTGPAIEAFAGKVGSGPQDRRSARARCSRWAARRSPSRRL